jgi:hypothetical protein
MFSFEFQLHNFFLDFAGAEPTYNCPMVQPAMIKDDECGGGITAGKGNRITRKRAAEVKLSLLKIPHDHTWYQILFAALASPELIATAMVRTLL